MVKTAANISVGAPSVITIGSYGGGKGAGVDVGSTVGPVIVKYDDEIYEVYADQWLGPVNAIKTRERATVEIVLAERSLANIALALGYPTTAVAGSVLEMGGNPVVTIREAWIDGAANTSPSGGTTQVYIKKCVVLGATELPMQRDGSTNIKLTLLLLQDTSKSANEQLIQITDSGGDTTPPTVAMTAPADGGNVTAGAKSVMTFTFTEAGAGMDEGSIIYGDSDNASVRIYDIENPLAITLVAGTLVYNATTKVATFTPTNNWAAATNNYMVAMDTKIRDIAGNHLASTFIGHAVSA
jgi:hypothetical protein